MPYHAYYYDLKYSEIFHPAPASTLVLFREAARRFENEYQNDDSELATRLGTQIYTNLCLLFAYGAMIEPKMAIDVSREEAQTYLTALDLLIERTKVWHPISYFVALVEKSVSLELSNMSPKDRLEQFNIFISELEQHNGTEIIEYDRRKIRDFRRYFESVLGV